MYLLPNIVVADDHCCLSDTTTTTQRAHTKHDTPNDQTAANDATLGKLQPEPKYQLNRSIKRHTYVRRMENGDEQDEQLSYWRMSDLRSAMVEEESELGLGMGRSW